MQHRRFGAPGLYVRVIMVFTTDNHMGRLVGEPYRGEPDVRFDEGAEGRKPTENLSLAAVNTHLTYLRTDALLYWRNNL